MKFDGAVLDQLRIDLQPRAYLRITPIEHASTPLGMGYGETRFASPSKAFKVLYIARTLGKSPATVLKSLLPLTHLTRGASVVGMKLDPMLDTLVPSGRIPEIQAAAEEEQRAPAELVGEAVERYLAERRWFRRNEVHAKIAEGLESLRRGKGLDGETVMSELQAELDDVPDRPL